MVSLSSVKTLCFTLGPLLLPKAISWFRTQKVKTATAPVSVQPVPQPIKSSFNILFLSALLALISTLPYFSPENIFTITNSRLQTPNDVLFVRLGLSRPDRQLTEADTILKPKLASLDARLLYLTYGPDVVTNCPFCISDDPMTYFYYALPSLMLPHILHLFALGLATSSVVAGKYGKRWRMAASAVGLTVALTDCYMFPAYDFHANARTLRPEHYVNFYWWMRTSRGVMIAIADAGVACLLYLASTNRFLVVPPTSAERMETAMKVLEHARGKLNAVGVMRNVVVRDEGLRRKAETYWKREGAIMGEVMDEREVVEGVRNALSGRIEVSRVEAEAAKYADGIVSWQQPPVSPG